jgi:hypothetical protein
MKQFKVLSLNNLPTWPPVLHTLVIWLVLRQLNAPTGIWVTFYIIMAVIWFICIILMVIEEKVDLFDAGKPSQDETLD